MAAGPLSLTTLQRARVESILKNVKTKASKGLIETIEQFIHNLEAGVLI